MFCPLCNHDVDPSDFDKSEETCHACLDQKEIDAAYYDDVPNHDTIWEAHN